ncbi:MAG TPA: SpoIIE family protein phosphatase [Polyangia bacterium]|jgi:anti-sigma regulatory factor (Ser/Thr protein kinase)/serine/threonine protein phosphatase PrpC|nr:SpoIIE family protein phosphatase [Polyangia bacterium]
MGPDLLHHWLGSLKSLPILDAASVSEAREWVRAEGAAAGLDKVVIESLVLAMSELGHNQLVHAGGGSVAVTRVERSGVPGLEIIAADQGPGIRDPAAGLLDRPSLSAMSPPAGAGSGSLQAGLAAVRRLTEEVDIDVRWGEGSCVRVRRFASPMPRRREVAVLGRALPGERISGDDAGVVRHGDTLILGVADGLGHGLEAREPSALAVDTLLQHAHEAPCDLLERCHRELQGTRGAMMTVVHIDEARQEIEHSGAGDVSARICRYRDERRLGGTARTLGRAELRPRPCRPDKAELQGGDVVVLFTDGLSSRLTLAETPGLLREHPILIAQQLMLSFARDNDDALIVVAR